MVILGNADITDEDAFTGAESLINLRPLTYRQQIQRIHL